MNFFEGFLDWALAVIEHWELLLTTGALVFFADLTEKLWKLEIPRKVYAVLVSIGLFLAMFAAWRDEHSLVKSRDANIKQLQQNIDDFRNPDFFIGTPESVFSYNPPIDQTGVWVLVAISNAGAPSIAGNWKLEIESPRINTTATYSQLPATAFSPTLVGKFKDDDSIYEKTIQKPIEKGAAVEGWAFFRIPGKTLSEELSQGSAVMRLICYDYRNKEYKSERFHTGTESIQPDYFPGVKGGFQLLGKDAKKKH